MQAARMVRYTYADYLRALEVSPLRLEYCQGEIYAMAGGTAAHAELCAAVIEVLRRELRGRCRVFTSDLKVRVEPTDLSTFPDVTVLCAERRASALDANSATNPTLLVEVTSPSTEAYDRGGRLSHYKQLESLQCVLFVSHDRPELTHVERTPSGWSERSARPGEVLRLAAPEVALSVDEVYAGVELGG